MGFGVSGLCGFQGWHVEGPFFFVCSLNRKRGMNVETGFCVVPTLNPKSSRHPKR